MVEGNRRVEADTIRSYFKSAGGGLSAATIDEGLKGLYATGLFQDIRIRQAGGRLIVTVVENPVINRIAFEGNVKAKDEQLLGEIQSKVRGTLSRPIVQSDTQRIIEQYRRNGRYDVRVVPKIIELPNNRVDLVFEVTEGKKTGVKSIRFVGNRYYSDFRLKDVIKTTESNFLSFLKSSDVYDPDRIEADRDLLRRFYLKHGFADVRVVSAVSEFDPQAGAFIVTFTIDEGEQYKFGAVDIQSNVRAVDAASLADRLKAKAGAVYNAEAVEKSVEAIAIDVARRGYPFAVVRPRGDRDFESRLINVVFTVEEGPRAYIERIQIRGNTRTRDWVIRREFDLAEGDAYNRALIDRAERRLKNLNYFKSVKITNEPGTSPDRVVINVEVEEQSTGEFSISGGYSTQDGWLAEVSVGERNLLGRGQAVRASVQYGQRARGFELSFIEPYFLDYRMALGLDFFAQGNQRAAIHLIRYADDRWRCSSRASNCAKTSRCSCVIRSTSRKSRCRRAIPTATRSFPGNPNNKPEMTVRTCRSSRRCRCVSSVDQGAHAHFAAGYSLIYNTLDNNRNPTAGIRAEFKQEFAGIGGDVNFIRSSGDARFYHEVVPDYVALLRVQAGNVSRLERKRSALHRSVSGRSESGARFPPERLRSARPDSLDDARRDRRREFLGGELRVVHPALLHSEGCRHPRIDLCRCRIGLELQGADQRPWRNDDLRGFQAHPHLGRRRPGLGFAVRAAAVRLCDPAEQGKLRYRAGIPLRRRDEVLIGSTRFGLARSPQAAKMM